MEKKEKSSGGNWLSALRRKLSRKFKKTRQKCENSSSLDSFLEELQQNDNFANPTTASNEIVSSAINSSAIASTNRQCDIAIVATGSISANSSSNLPTVMMSNKECEDMKKELSKISCYWPSLSRFEAQKLLSNQPNGSFLVRDSSEKDSFTLSFRTNSKTFHCRNQWSQILASKNDTNHSLIDIIEESIKKSQSSVVGFVKCDQSDVSFPAYAVRLIFPINRKITVPTLQLLCLSKIKSKVNQSNINSLPLPPKIKEYVQENYNTL